MSTRFPPNSTIPWTVTCLGTNEEYLTGLIDVKLWIRRRSDGLYFDFAGGWGVNRTQHVMTEMDATNDPGTYEYYFDTTGMADDDYRFASESVTSASGPWAEWYYTGGMSSELLGIVYEDAETLQDLLRLLRSIAAGNRDGYVAGHSGTGKFYSADGTKIRITSPHDRYGNTNGTITTDTSD